MIKNYIIVDDDNWSNEICAFNIKKKMKDASTISFLSPEKALAYIKHTFSEDLKPTILFLDINMPVINGWDFLDMFAFFSDEIKSNITIHMLSSSISPLDEEKAKNNEYVKSFISKPLTIEIFGKLVSVEG